MVKAAEEVEVHIITDQVNQIIVRVISIEWELSTVVNYYKRNQMI